MIWNSDKVELLDQEIGAYSISVRCKLQGGLDAWIFSGVHGPILRRKVDDFLMELDDVKACWDLPWCIGGDFNLVYFSHECKGEGCRDCRMDKFGDFISRWNLIDGPLKGTKYTWSNFQDVPLLSRLDRFLYYNSWEDLFLGGSQSALARSVLDDTPILLESGWGRGGGDQLLLNLRNLGF